MSQIEETTNIHNSEQTNSQMTDQQETTNHNEQTADPQEPYVYGQLYPTVYEQMYPTEQAVADQHESYIYGQQYPTDQPPDPNIATWNGQRPFVGAVVQYKQMLDDAVCRAINLLRLHPAHAYMKVKLHFFGKIVVQCQIGTQEVYKTYSLHDVHYAPRCKTQRHSEETELNYSIRSFKTRYWKMWVDINTDPTKNSGGNGTGINNTPCSVFRTMQMQLVPHGLFLIDMSDFSISPQSRRMHYNVDVRVYRRMPEPAKCWHQYGLIPGLGAIPKANTNANAENDDEINWPPLR